VLYRTSTYQTLNGSVQIIELPDATYGEWIIYNKDKPEFFVNVFSNSISDVQIRLLIESHSETIETILNKINKKQGTHLTLGKAPLLGKLKSSELIEWDLEPILINWINHLT